MAGIANCGFKRGSEPARPRARRRRQKTTEARRARRAGQFPSLCSSCRRGEFFGHPRLLFMVSSCLGGLSLRVLSRRLMSRNHVFGDIIPPCGGVCSAHCLGLADVALARLSGNYVALCRFRGWRVRRSTAEGGCGAWRLATTSREDLGVPPTERRLVLVMGHESSAVDRPRSGPRCSCG
jgi:hypothetical protein